MEQPEIYKDYIYLVSCGMHQTAPDPERVRNMDLQQVYNLCQRQSLDALACSALQMMDAPPSDPIFKSWVKQKDKAAWQEMLFDIEREALFAFLDQIGAWYIPLKGIFIKEYYPGPGLRQMADNDILFDPAFRVQVRDWFQARGYEVTAFQNSIHDVYQKKPAMNFEMHVQLFIGSDYEKWVQYWADIPNRAVKIPGTACGYRMRREDAYLYFLAHAFKHYQGSGTGLRTLADEWLLLKQLGSSLDRQYLGRELAVLGLTEFEEKLRRLAKSVFDDVAGDPEKMPASQQKMLLYMLSGGSYGSFQNRIESRLQKLEGSRKTVSLKTRISYLWKRLFPDQEHFAVTCQPAGIYTNPIKRTCYYIRRILKKIFRKETVQELRCVWKSEK